MQLSTLRALVRERTLEFAWDSWAQMGVFAATEVEDDRAADPEALLVYTLDIGRHDPRLFDEVLDWLRENERFVSVQRLRNLSDDATDRRVVDAALRWVSQFRSNPRFGKARQTPDYGTSESLFAGRAEETWRPDAYFSEVGLIRPELEPSMKSGSPDVSEAINFAFRMRLAFGVGSRAEIMRYLLTVPAPDASAQLVSQVVAFAKRNVADALDALVDSGMVSPVTRGTERRYAIDREAWLRVLRIREAPRYREWPHLLRAIRRVGRWIEDPALDDRSESMRASAARDLLAQIEHDLLFAGVPVLGKELPGARFWDGFSDTVEGAVEALRP